MSQLKPRDPDDLAREKIPTREDVPTRYHPHGSFMMVVPLPDQTKVGLIYLPQTSKIKYNEGHIVEFGTVKPANLELGDCITWNPQSEFGLEIDGVPFVLLEPVNVIMRIPRTELDPDKQWDECPHGTPYRYPCDKCRN